MERHHILLALLLASHPIASSSLKVLLMPFDHQGHVNFFSIAGQSLQQQGHNVLLLTQKRHQPMLEQKRIPFLLYPSLNSSAPTADPDRVAGFFFSSGFQYILNFRKWSMDMTKAAIGYCNELVANDNLMTRLREEQFDVAIVDGSDFGHCMFIIPYKLDIKFISLSARHHPWSVKVPAMPSVEGLQPVNIVPENPGFLDRCYNLGMSIIMHLMLPPPLLKDEQIADLAPEKPRITYSQLWRKAELFLINGDNYCSDFPRTYAPHYHFIGGLAAQPALPLPPELDKVYKEAADGVVVVSFGSLVEELPIWIMNKLLSAFAEFPCTFIMKYNGTAKNLPSNVLLFDWLPQNDLLGHPSTIMFIGHGGQNGQMEAVYHGVPMLVLPFAADQFYNAWRVEEKGFGLRLHPFEMTQEEFTEAIRKLIQDPQFSENIKRCSAILKDFPSPHDRLNFWIEHVVKYGGDHLKPRNMDMPILQYFCLDICFVVNLLVISVIFSLYKVCAYCRRRSDRVVGHMKID